MKHSLFKRVLSLALCLLMVVTIVPFNVGAASSLGGLNFAWPVDTSIGIYTDYGPYRTISGFHTGLDFSNRSGGAIYAAESGTIHIYEKECNGSHRTDVSSGLCNKGKACQAARDSSNGKGSYGNYARIDHTGTYSSIYGHILSNSWVVEDNTYVEKGQKIAEMGNSGNSQGTHLHFEIRKNGSAFDPEPYITKTNEYHFDGVKVEVDTAYPTNFTAIAKGSSNDKIAVYSSKYGGSKLTNRWIGGGDQCTIHEVYIPGGRCRVTYPGSNNQPVTGYYANISDFNIGDYSISVNKEGNTRSSMTAKYLVYPEWIYPGTYYEAYSGAVTSNNPLVSVTVSISSRDTDTKIVKNWKENDNIPTRAVTFIENLPIKPEEFAKLKQGKYTFKVSASCNKKILGIFNTTTDEVTIFESTFYVSKTDPSSNGNTTVTSRSGGKREVVAIQAKTQNYNSGNVINGNTNNYYNGVSSYPIGTYKVKVNTSLNVRKGPGTNNTRVSSYSNGTIVNVTATNGNWGYTDRGWICLDYTTFVSYPESTYDSGIA